MVGVAALLHKDREEILSFCHTFKKIFIYGAGLIASQLIEYMLEENISIEAIIISDDQKNQGIIRDINVIRLSSIQFSDDDGIILAINSMNQRVVVDMLGKKGVNENQIYHQMIYSVSSSPALMLDGIYKRNLSDEKSDNGFFSGFSTLNALGREFKTDKSDSFHNYLSKYEFFLKEWRKKEFNLLELGVLDGSSLKVWESYFFEAHIYGVDINPNCKELEGGRKHVKIMDLSQIESYKELSNLKPSIIIDDGSHIWSHQLKSLFYLFRVLPPGGIFIIEDLETSFSAYRGYYYADTAVSTYQVLSVISEVVCGNEVIQREKVSAVIWEIRKDIEEIAHSIELISFIHGSCIIIKK